MFKEINEREFGLIDMIVKGWSVYCQQFKTITVIILFVYIPSSILNYVMNTYAYSSEYIKIAAGIFEGSFSMIAMMGIAVIVENAVTNNRGKIGWAAALRRAFSRWRSAIGTAILVVLNMTWPLYLLVIPGVLMGIRYGTSGLILILLEISAFIWSTYYFICYIFIMNFVVLHQISGKTALNYSKALVNGRWWKVSIIISILAAINYGLDFGIRCGLSFLPDGSDIINYFFAKIFKEIVYAFDIVAQTILFLNLVYISEQKCKVENAVELSERDKEQLIKANP